LPTLNHSPPRILCSILVALLPTVITSPSWAQAPPATGAPTTRLVPISGVLSDGRGQPISGSVAVTFELFDSQLDGTLLWTETQQVEADGRGRYTVYLGAAAGVAQEAFSSEQARWLAVTVDGRELPRTMLVAVPYALHAADAENLGGQPASSYVRSRADGKLETNGGIVVAEPAIEGSGIAGQIAKFTGGETLSSSVISESARNRIGFGLTDPTGSGVVDSVFTIRNFDNNTGFGILNQSQQRRFAINTLANGGWTMYDGGSNIWNQGLIQTNGLVGLGAPPVSNKLEVNGGAARGIWGETTGDFAIIGHVVTGSGTAVLGETIDGTGVYAFSVNGTALRVSGGGVGIYVSTGNVGIGTPTPADRLHAVGDIRVGTGTTGCVKDADATVIAGVCSSDRRLKERITPFPRALENVAKLQPVNFYWRANEYADRHLGSGQTFGLIAQDVEQVLPDLVTTDEQGFKAVRYNALPMHMLQAIKDLKAENDELKERLTQQEERLRRLEGAASK
jgi:hypothetical protein